MSLEPFRAQHDMTSALHQHLAAAHIIVVATQILLMVLRGATFTPCLFLALVERWVMVLLLIDNDGVVWC